MGKGSYPYRQAVEGAGSDGSVILSRHPLKPAAGIPATMGMPGATADVKGHEIRLQLAHPMPPLPAHLSTWREELSDLRDYAAANRTRPTVLAGDFNASQDHAASAASWTPASGTPPGSPATPAAELARPERPRRSAPRSTTSSCPGTSRRTEPASWTSANTDHRALSWT